MFTSNICISLRAFRLRLISSILPDPGLAENCATLVTAETWQEVFDDEGSIYYHNTVTGETSWELPSPIFQHEQVEGTDALNNDDNALGNDTASGGWEEAYDDDGNLYFYHSATGETAWELPESDNARSFDEPATSVEQWHGHNADGTILETPRQWTEHIDEQSGETYYHNPATGETSWEKPALP